MEKNQEIVISVENLHLSFKNNRTNIDSKVIRGVSFDLHKGEILALIGESGSGKSVVTSILNGLQAKNAIIESGKITLNGINITNFTEKDWSKLKLRGKVISQVFQDPMSSLNPSLTVGYQLIESSIINKRSVNKKDAKRKAIELMERIGIKDAKNVYKLYPHQLSGGMRQRICIAAILLCEPEIIIFDEPTTALDPTIQAEILLLIQEIKNSFNVSIIFISHDLGVVGSIADRIAIMYAGKIVEYGKTIEVLFNGKHPYTWGLISSMPDANNSERLHSIPGSVPSNFNDIKGDAFAPRNQWALDIDFIQHPPFFKVSETHYAATWLLDEKAEKIDPPNLIIERWNKFKKIMKNEE